MNVDVVLVTYNRLEKLKKSLLCYDKQTVPFRSIIVVNNCSTDGTKEYLGKWLEDKNDKYSKHVINTSSNLGGSGGFYIGQEYAAKLKPEWIFLADDDAYPHPNMIEEFENYCTHKDVDGISAICATVYNADGTICYNHRSYVKLKKAGLVFSMTHSSESDYNKDFSIDLLSYVGSFVNASKMKKVGLVNKDYFIYADDAEHSLRLKSVGDIICVPSVKITHDSGQENEKNDENIVSWRDYYAERNFIHMLKKHYPLAVPFKICDVIKRANKYADSDVHAMYKKAIMDALFNRLGVHHIYKPGWSIKK